MRFTRATLLALVMALIPASGAAQELVRGGCDGVDAAWVQSAIETRLYEDRSEVLYVELAPSGASCRATLTNGVESTDLGEIWTETRSEDIESIASRAAFLISSGWPPTEEPEPEPEQAVSPRRVEEAVAQARAISGAAAISAFATARAAAGPGGELENPDLGFLSLADDRVAGQSFSIFEDADKWADGRAVVPFVAVFVPGVHTPLPPSPHVVNFALEFVGGSVQAIEGAQFSMIGTHGADYMIGARFAGIYSVTNGPVLGAHFAGIASIAEGPVGGYQGAGAVNVSRGGVRGAQGALVNINGGELEGAQLGMVNINGDTVRGAQLGMVNIAASVPAGAQLGMVNITRDVNVQLGMVNIADDSDVSIGMVSVVRQRPVHFTLTGNERGVLMGGVRHGSRYVQNIYEVGFSVNGENHLYLGGGLGTEFQIGAVLTQLDILGHTVFQLESGTSSGQTLTRLVGSTGELRLTFGASLGRLALFGGPTYTVYYSRDGTFGVPPSWGQELSRTGRDRVNAWPGFRAGVRF